MSELLIGVLSAMLAYFLMRLDSLEKRLNILEDKFMLLPKRREDG